MGFAVPLHEDVSFDICWSFYNPCWYRKKRVSICCFVLAVRVVRSYE
jgi:hypothetical protein